MFKPLALQHVALSFAIELCYVSLYDADLSTRKTLSRKPEILNLLNNKLERLYPFAIWIRTVSMPKELR